MIVTIHVHATVHSAACRWLSWLRLRSSPKRTITQQPRVTSTGSRESLRGDPTVITHYHSHYHYQFARPSARPQSAINSPGPPFVHCHLARRAGEKAEAQSHCRLHFLPASTDSGDCDVITITINSVRGGLAFYRLHRNIVLCITRDRVSALTSAKS